jgi:hypothetical protein
VLQIKRVLHCPPVLENLQKVIVRRYEISGFVEVVRHPHQPDFGRLNDRIRRLRLLSPAVAAHHFEGVSSPFRSRARLAFFKDGLQAPLSNVRVILGVVKRVKNVLYGRVRAPSEASCCRGYRNY